MILNEETRRAGVSGPTIQSIYYMEDKSVLYSISPSRSCPRFERVVRVPGDAKSYPLSFIQPTSVAIPPERSYTVALPLRCASFPPPARIGSAVYHTARIYIRHHVVYSVLRLSLLVKWVDESYTRMARPKAPFRWSFYLYNLPR